MCSKYFVFVCCREAAEFVYKWMIGWTQKRAGGSGFFFRCICRFESVSRTWFSSLSEGVTASDEPPTHTGSSVLSVHQWEGLFHKSIVKPELLVGLFSNVARVLILVRSDGRAPAVPSLSLTIRSLCPPAVPGSSQQLCCSSVPGCSGVPAGRRAGLSDSPSVWISPLAVGVRFKLI